jgi:hypothetical protein
MTFFKPVLVPECHVASKAYWNGSPFTFAAESNHGRRAASDSKSIIFLGEPNGMTTADVRWLQNCNGNVIYGR